MPPKVVDRELKALADQEAPGALTERVEAAVDVVTDKALDALAAEMGGKGARSKAIRLLLQKGAVAVVAERAARA
jgi:hypothetical protein